MIDRTFIDTNILVYISVKDDVKTEKITKLIYNLQNVVISTQVLCEFSNVIYRNKVLSSSQLKDYIIAFSNSFEIFKITIDTINNAIRIKDRYMFSFWDSMILASAIESDCNILYSEDMQHLQIIDDKLTIINPIKDLKTNDKSPNRVARE
jgi:predicted nucleic acid-binding protein